MQATGSTSTKRGPDDPADGLHPVLHVTLRTGHEQEPLGAGRHLLPLPGTTCKTGRHRLTPGTGPCADTAPSPGPLQPHTVIVSLPAVGREGRLSANFSNSPALGSTSAAQPFNPHTCRGALSGDFSFSLVIFLYRIGIIKPPGALFHKAYRLEARLEVRAQGEIPNFCTVPAPSHTRTPT